MSDDSVSAIKWDRAPATQRAKNAVEHLMVELEESEARQRARRKDDRERLVTTLGAFALELYAASKDGGSGWRRYSRAKSDYGRPSRYNASPVTHTTVRKVADWMLKAGYAHGQRGHYKRYPGFGKGVGAGKQSRICASKKLVALFEQAFEMTPHHVGFAPWLETVVLRDVPEERGLAGSEIGYTDTRETIAMRKNLQRINDGLSAFRLSLLGHDGTVRDLPPFRLRRIFNRGSFELGGRFYGGPWIELPSEDRPALLIDGEEVVELDFSAFHPRLIYQLEGKPLPSDADPYAVQGWEGEERRGWAKTAFQKIVNSQPGARIYKPQDVPTSKIGKGGWQKLIADLTRNHAEISGWLRSGRGLELQRIDSDMAEWIMLAMLDQGICCLTIHDNFIVPRSHEHHLRQAMMQGYHEVLARRGCTTSDPIIHARAPAVLFH